MEGYESREVICFMFVTFIFLQFSPLIVREIKADFDITKALAAIILFAKNGHNSSDLHNPDVTAISLKTS